jgi:cardiolipin synthase A/B
VKVLEPVYIWLSSELLTVLGFALALVLLAHLLKQQRSPTSTIAWLLTILLLPYVGVPLYLMFGGRKIRRMAGRKEPVYRPGRGSHGGEGRGPVERVLRSYGVPEPTAGNRVSLARDGQEAYRQLLRLIDEAERTIHITTYILGRDAVGEAIVERLARRAAGGVEVRLLLDSLGSWWVRRRRLAPLLDAGGRVAWFMPVIHWPFRGRANLRNHRKIVVVDDRQALAGGMNLAEEYMGPTPLPSRWRDLSVVVSGPAARDLGDLFRSDWKFATGEELPADAPPPAREGHDGAPVQVVASGPDVPGDPLYESMVSAIFAARRRVWVVTPYFIPDETLVRALDLAARRGTDVRLVVPARSNKLMADLARTSYIRQVHDAGGRALLYQPGMVHAKAVVVDDDLAIVGSANMDMRSLFLNYEVALFLVSPPEVEGTASYVETLMADCVTRLPARNRVTELAEDVVRLLSPLL